MDSDKSTIKEKYSHAPHKPGVYIFRDDAGDALYIGKARDIKKRLASYVFGTATSRRIGRMLARAATMEWIVTDNELEALILEANMIRQNKPHYNVLLKDDKRYPYLRITNEDFPRIMVVRRKQNDGGLYFGPYADRMGAVKLMRTIRSLFRLRTCKHTLPSKKNIRPCILFDIGRCLGPCARQCDVDEYNHAVDEVVMFLRGRRKELLKKLKSQMNIAAENLQFERAAHLRDMNRQLERMMTPQKMDSDMGNRDFIILAAGGGVGVAVIFRIRQGAMIARQIIPLDVPKLANTADSLAEFILHFYSEDGDIPDEIIVGELPSEFEDIAKSLSNMRGKNVSIKIPKKGGKRETLLLVMRNAELLHSEMLMQKQKTNISYSVLELERLLELPKTPNRIEAFDISNFGDRTIVASMIQFVNGRANRKGYRHFRIKSIDTQDDFASMREVVFRRYRRILTEEKPLPELVLIDGGKGQLSAAMQSLHELNILEIIPLIAIAKRIDEIFVPGRADAIMLPKDSAALRMLQRIRDEAHRFAITFARKSHRKKAMQLELTEVDGIGEKRAARLLKEFGGIEEITAAPVEEIVKRGKLPQKVAENVIGMLRPASELK